MNFEEQFPSLAKVHREKYGMIGIDKDLLDFEEVKKHCLDKQKVMDLAEKWKSGLEHIGLDLKKELGL
jgi:hypothetical protein